MGRYILKAANIYSPPHLQVIPMKPKVAYYYINMQVGSSGTKRILLMLLPWASLLGGGGGLLSQETSLSPTLFTAGLVASFTSATVRSFLFQRALLAEMKRPQADRK